MAAAVQITARGSRADIEAADAALEADLMLEAAAWSRIEEDEGRNVWRIDAYPASGEEAHAFKRVLDGLAGLKVAASTLADADWVSLSLSGLPPVRAGRFFVYGAHDRGRVPANAVALRIEAGGAFGTGHHGTTVGCLLALDGLLKARRFVRVLDVGTGTGVLAIAAARTGSRGAVGTDIDKAAVAIAAQNARLNHAQVRFRHAAGAVRGRHDLIFANILAAPLVDLATDIRRALAPAGVAILSGLLRSQSRRVLAAYVARGFALERRVPRDAWMTLVVRRRG
jgi:ribosomal protein L11 methyltransferase